MFPETGQSATHDEFVAARTAGIPRLVFHKTGVDPDAEQAGFITAVGDYSVGSFWAHYESVPELQTLATRAIRELEAQPSPLTFEPLTESPNVQWKDDWHAGTPSFGFGHVAPFIELHAVDLAGNALSARQLGDLGDPLVTKLRTFGVLPVASGAEVDVSETSVTITVPTPDRRFDQAVPHRFAGVRVTKSGQVSVWSTLPHDNMGGMLDETDLRATLVEQLGVIGVLGVLTGDRFALAPGLGGSMSRVTIASPGIARSSVSGFGSDQPVRVDPDESVSAAAFDVGADDVARILARSVITRLGG
ncbi:hypothetical protein [Solicola sp. PLA-1-18]|uniref:hypothetical protein n=1 Tax=Solicola sp. PLA-1-18 TaxID=3380532 RepID=UPI003B7E72BC